LSRRHQITTSTSGVVSVTGGKFTTYRQMAEDTVDVVMDRLGRPHTRWRGRSPTRRLPLLGADGYRPSTGDHPHHRLSRRYGSLVGEVKDLIRDDPSLGEPLVPGLRYLRAEAVYAVRHEMATSLVDVLTRRTRAHLHDRGACRAAAADVAAVLAPELGWSDTEATSQVAAYLAMCDAEELAASPDPASAR
jgi:glycerol-3-phosphate dehydrogenase